MTTRGLPHDTTRESMLAVLVAVQKGLCGLCGKPMDISRAARRSNSKMRPTIEHVLPLHNAHALTWRGNVIASHSKCNNRKGGRYPTDEELAFLAAVNRALGWDEQERKTA